MRCQCITTKGLQCKLKVSTKKGENANFCSRYHQKCEKIASNEFLQNISSENILNKSPNAISTKKPQVISTRKSQVISTRKSQNVISKKSPKGILSKKKYIKTIKTIDDIKGDLISGEKIKNSYTVNELKQIARILGFDVKSGKKSEIAEIVKTEYDKQKRNALLNIGMNGKNSEILKQEYVNITGSYSFHIGNYKGQKFYFIGDRHFGFENSCNYKDCLYMNKKYQTVGTDIKCLETSKLLDILFKIAKMNNEYVDVYLEYPYVNKRIPEHPSPYVNLSADFMSKTLNFLFECMKKKPECEYKNVRFNYVDVRATIGEDKIYTSLPYTYIRLFTEKGKIYGKEAEIFKNFIILNSPRDLYKTFLFSHNYNVDIQNIIDTLNEKYEKQCGKVPNKFFNRFKSKLKNNIVKRHDKSFTKIGMQLYELSHQGEGGKIISGKLKQYIQNYIINYIEILYDENPNMYLFYMASFFMDIYTLARMFRTFPNKNHITSKKVLTYAGFAHIERILYFFRNYLDVPIKTYKQIDVRCTNVPVLDLF